MTGMIPVGRQEERHYFKGDDERDRQKNHALDGIGQTKQDVGDTGQAV